MSRYAPRPPAFVPPPAFPPEARPRGARAAGLAYQRKLGKALRAQGFAPLEGPWIREASGALAQPDILVGARGETGAALLFIIECKLAQDDAAALAQLRRYGSLLAAMGYGRALVAVQATKWLRQRWQGRAGRTYAGPGFAGLAAQAQAGERWLWHWLG